MFRPEFYAATFAALIVLLTTFNQTARAESWSWENIWSFFSSENVSAVCPTDPVVTNNGESGAGKGNHLWNKLFHYYCLNKEQFLEHYYKRSNAETAFSMLKAKFGGGVRSRTAQINESLCKILAHNICVLIQSMAELNIKFGFWQENY